MTQKTHYTEKQLTLFIVQDLIKDIRFSIRKINTSMDNINEVNYRKDLLIRLKDIFIHRHTVRLDRYGWPMLSTFKIK